LKQCLSFEATLFDSSLASSKSCIHTFTMSRYLTGLNRTSEKKGIAFLICTKFPFLILSVSLHYDSQTKIQVKIYCQLNLAGLSIFNFGSIDILQDSIRHMSKSYGQLNLLGSSVLNFECLDILRDLIQHPSKKLLPYEFARIFRFNLERSIY